jgi:hypothetical protein
VEQLPLADRAAPTASATPHGATKQNKQKPTGGRKLVLKQKIEGAAIKNRKGQFQGAVGIYRGIER